MDPNIRFEYFIYEIDKNGAAIEKFNDETLFMNIYNCYCFSHYLSPKEPWEKQAIRVLKENIIKKWPKKDFCNVFLFLELISCKDTLVNPTLFFWRSEDYFEHLINIKTELDQRICDRHLFIIKNNNVKVKCIR